MDLEHPSGHAPATVDAYRTIVVDPPWPYEEGFASGHGRTVRDGVETVTSPATVTGLPYAAMSLEDIKNLPLGSVAAEDCRLFLWTTNRYLPAAFDVLAAWGFEYRQTLVWHKTDVNLPAHVAPNSAEYVLVAVRGAPERIGTMPSSVIATTRYGGPGVASHSRKRECWLDYVEQVSPGPYLEMFARRDRLGWDTWGNESLGTAEVASMTNPSKAELLEDFALLGRAVALPSERPDTERLDVPWPMFCFTPDDCAGHWYCHRSPACSE